MVVTFSTWKIDLELLPNILQPKYELSIQKLTHNENLIQFVRQKQEFGQKRAEMWKNASRDGRHLCEIEDSFIGGRQVFGVKSAAI